ncbi:MAG: hypothetical protein GF375_06600, partial [Candidatus Omnitrophica bacterium]|nr:hypothetical protein [Candidatus Omnitrophota bacterium]MBD3269643.1 hypothetical protein [Candidatus Omnitrophota bacterium]
MFCWLSILSLLFAFLATKIFALRDFKKNNLEKRKSLSERYKALKIETKRLQAKIDDLDSNLSEYFLFYDTTRKIAPLLDKNKLFSVFSEEIHHLGNISDIRFGDFSGEQGYLKFELEDEQEEYLSIKTNSRKVIEYIPYFVKLLSLCLDKMRLYHRLQELSILDS